MIRWALALCIAALLLVPGSASATRSFNPTALDFGAQAVGSTSAAKTATFSLQCNTDPGDPATCTSDTVLTPMTTVSGPFSQTNNCPSPMLAMTQGVATQCTFTVKFSPTANGSATGAVNLSGTVLPLSGSGFGGPVTTPPSTTTALASHRKKCKKKRHRASTAKKCRKKHG